MRPRFKRSCIGSSRGGYVYRAHVAYIKEYVENNKEHQAYIAQIEATTIIEPKYYIKCFGRTKEITKEEALKMDPNLIIRL